MEQGSTVCRRLKTGGVMKVRREDKRGCHSVYLVGPARTLECGKSLGGPNVLIVILILI